MKWALLVIRLCARCSCQIYKWILCQGYTFAICEWERERRRSLQWREWKEWNESVWSVIYFSLIDYNATFGPPSSGMLEMNCKWCWLEWKLRVSTDASDVYKKEKVSQMREGWGRGRGRGRKFKKWRDEDEAGEREKEKRKKRGANSCPLACQFGHRRDLTQLLRCSRERKMPFSSMKNDCVTNESKASHALDSPVM